MKKKSISNGKSILIPGKKIRIAEYVNGWMYEETIGEVKEVEVLTWMGGSLVREKMNVILFDGNAEDTSEFIIIEEIK